MESQTDSGRLNKDTIIFGVVLFLFFASFAALFGVSIYELTKKEPEHHLLFIGEEETQLQVTSEWTDIYNFYTKNVDTTLKSYKGEYNVVMNNSSGVDFRVVDEDGNVMGSTVKRGSSFVGSVVPFNSNGKSISNIILQYTSVHNSTVSRIEIEVE